MVRHVVVLSKVDAYAVACPARKCARNTVYSPLIYSTMRLLIKLSGEALRGPLARGDGDYHEPTLADIAAKMKTLRDAGHEIALVIGGGNLFRGVSLVDHLSIARPTADYIGMLATVQNALVLRDYFESKGIETRVSSAIAMRQVCEEYMPRRVVRHLEKGRIVIFAAGLGAPFFTTDTTAVQRALEMSADLLVMAKNGVDGLYSADPDKDPNATKIASITATEVIERDLKAADQAAIALAKEQGLTIKIVGLGDVIRAADGGVGSVILPK